MSGHSDGECPGPAPIYDIQSEENLLPGNTPFCSIKPDIILISNMGSREEQKWRNSQTRSSRAFSRPLGIAYVH